MTQRDKGARFYNCDFQVHTPRDLQWTGNDVVSDEDRLEFAKTFVTACRTKGLNAVAITDHHDVAFFKYIKQAAEIEVDTSGDLLPPEDRLIVFPGMELTLSAPPCQALLILDADFPVSDLDMIPSYLAINPAPREEAKTGQINHINCVTGFRELYDRLDGHEHLKGRYIVFPHVQDGGHQTLLRSGFARFYREMPCVGGYLDGSISRLGTGNTNIVNGRDRNYGHKAISFARRDMGTVQTFSYSSCRVSCDSRLNGLSC